MTDPIKPNGKRELTKALPKEGGGAVLALREAHFQTSMPEYLRENISELRKEHAVGSIGLEMAPFMMVLEWAHKDGKLGMPEQEKLLLEQAYLGIGSQEFAENGKAKAALAHAAHEQGIDIVYFNARDRTPLANYNKHFAREVAEMETLARVNGEPVFEQLKDDTKQVAWLLRVINKLCDENPEYKVRLEKIETLAATMQKKHIPQDIVNATLFTQLADQKANAVTIIGSDHQGGFFTPSDWRDPDRRTQGIFDEGLAAAGWKVTDAIIGSEADIKAMADMYRPGRKAHPLDSFDVIDMVYATDNDIVAHPGIAEMKGQDLPLGLEKDVFSRTTAKPLAKVCKQEWLIDPSLVPELKTAIDDMRRGLHAEIIKLAVPKATQETGRY